MLGPASAVRGSRRTTVGLSLAGLSLVRPVPVVRSSLAESRQRRPCSLRESRSESICQVRHGRDRPGYPIVRDR